MTTILKPWLWPGIEKEVRQTLSWKVGPQSASHPVEEVLLFEDDDSNLRIQSVQVPKVVQIIKFLTFEDPVQAVISDKTTCITATIASIAAEQFNRKYNKRITENTKGCLIQLLQFEIVATHHGPSEDRLTLRIQELKHLGCDGEGTFGNPQPIIQQDGIRLFLNELKAFRVRVSAKRAEDRIRDLEESLHSQESNNESEDHENDVVNSQLVFATQHPNRKSAKAPSRSLLGREQAQKTEVFEIIEDGTPQSHFISSEEVEQNILSLLKQPKEVERTNPPNFVAPPLAPSVKPRDSKAKPFNTSDLLALLQNNGGKSITRPVLSSESIVKRTLSGSPNSTDHSKDRGSLKVQTGKASQVASIIEKTETSAESILNKTPVLHIAQKNATNEAEQLESPDTLPQGVPTSDVGLHSRAVVSQDIGSPSRPSPLDGAVSHIEDVEDPWHGMIHIKRKAVTIPKNQQILLDRKDCWLPPEPGSRGPVANIPVPILQTFTAMIEKHTDITAIAAVIRQDDCDSLSEPAEVFMPHIDVLGSPDSIYEEEDIPISTGEWPPSSPPVIPKIDQLPLDSSLEVTPARVRKGEKQQSRTDSPETPSSNVRASLARNQVLPEIDMRVPVGPLGDSGQYVARKRYKLQQKHKQNSVHEVNLVHIDSDSDHGFEYSSETEAAVSKYNVQSGNGSARKADNEVENGYVEANKNLHDIDGNSNITDEQQNLEMIPPVYSDEEMSSHQQASHSRLRSDHQNIAPLNTTTYHSMLLDEPNSEKDNETAYSSSSELETSVPNALCGGNTSVCMTQQRSTPMYISDSRKPTLQVHRTPYTNQDYRTKTGIMPRNLAAEKLADGLLNTDKVTRQNSTSDGDSATEDIIPGTYSQLNSAQKPVVGRSHGCHTGNVETGAPIFHGRWVPYLSEEATKERRKSCGAKPARTGIADVVRVNKRGLEDSAITSPNVIRRRERTKSPKVVMMENEQQREDPSIKARQLRREFLNNLKAQSRTSALIPDVIPDGSGNKLPKAPIAEPVLPNSSQYNRGLSVSQGLCESRTTCTQTPEATSSRSGTPWRDVRVTELEQIPRFKAGSTSLMQDPPNVLPSDLVDWSIFSSFQNAYPMYQGNERHFATMCQKIQRLEMDHRMEHRSLWDDFVIRHKMEYRTYLLECSEQADDPMPYEDFYHVRIDEPQFNKRLITPNNLYEAISQSLQNGDQLVTSTETFNREGVGLAPNGHELQETTREQVPTLLPVGTPIIRNSPSQRNSPFRRNSSTQNNVTLQRSSPLRHSSPLQRDSATAHRSPSQSLTPMKSTPQPSPILGTPRTIVKTPRPLPWKRKTSDDPSSSGQKSKRRNVFNNALSSSEPHQFQALAGSPTRNTTAFRCTFPATTNLSGTGIWDPISSPTKFAGIQNNRMQRNARKGTDITSAPAPQPLAAHHTAALPRPSPPTTLSSPSANKKAVPVSLQPSAAPVQPWYLDPVNPFKSFARAEASIRSGHGNGFVDEKSKVRVKETKAEIENGIVLTRMKKIDILGWEL
ncbi:hypothetical protein MMC18_009474 [Xylographa bjoerkii]|nr:hypothetical protein [Xylographa bjoerkii]